MNAFEIYKAQFEEERTWYPDEWDKYEWAARKIFNLITYDGSLDERFIKDIIEVCKVILEKRHYEYIKDESNYIKYILVCQMLKQFDWINWGTSIRGAWFGASYHSSRDILEYLEWGDVAGRYKFEAVPFTVDNLRLLLSLWRNENMNYFNTEFPTWIIAYCPDTNSWFCTNQRFFYYEYPTEFQNENDAVEYFRNHVAEFIELTNDMYPSKSSGIFLENTMEVLS